MDIFSGQPHLFLLSLGLVLVQILHGALGLTITNSISNSRPQLGDTLTLTCNVAGGTAYQVVWWKDRHHGTKAVYVTFNCLVAANEYKSRLTPSGCSAPNYNFVLKNVQISDKGEWECEADGVGANSKITLDVLVPPLTPTVSNPSPVKVGERAKFTCNAENENVTKPVTYTWIKSGNAISPGTSEKGSLLFTQVAKVNAGTYFCKAENEAGSKSSPQQEFVVYYAPDSMSLKTTSTSNSKTESETETFTCEVIGGNPVPTIKLIRQDGANTKQTLIEEKKRTVLFRRQMLRQDNRVKFYCEATGPGITNYMLSAIITYNVLFPHNVQVLTSKNTVVEHEFVRFECKTTNGNPELINRYKWLWRPQGSTKEQVIQDTDTSTQNGKVLEFARIPYDKSGTYYCQAWNDGGMGQGYTDLNVQFSPRIDPTVKMVYDVAGEMGKEISFELFIIANPKPVTTGYIWYREDTALSQSKDYDIDSGEKSSKLTIKNVKSSDYRNYTCRVKTSGFQEKVFRFKLLKAGPPSAPTKLKVLNSTAVSATLEWISEFPGGSEQKFYVQYKQSADKWEVASEVPPGGIADPGLKKTVYHKVTGLESNVWYVFRVRSKNSHPGPHTSNFSNIASGKTPEAPQTSVAGVSRADNKVTIRWKQVTGKYTLLKIKYCQTGTEDCANYTVPDPSKNYAAFYVDGDKTYYYYLIVEDGGDVVYNSLPLVVDDQGKTGGVTTANIGLIAGMVGAAVLLILVVIIVIVVVMRKKKPRDKKKREAQEMQNNVINDQLTPLDGQVNHAMHRTPTRSECDPTEHHSYPPSIAGSQQNLTPLHVNLQKPDVVSHTQGPENPYQNVPVSYNGSRPPSVASRASHASRPPSRAEENPYQNVNVNRNGQPQRYSGGVPQRIGVDGTVYAELSFHGPRNPTHPQYNPPIRRTEEFAPYASIDFSRKAPPMNVEYTV